MKSFFVTGFSRRQVKSTTDTSGVGTRKDIPVNLPLSDGITFPTYFQNKTKVIKNLNINQQTALAAPVVDGIIFCAAPRPPRQS